MDKLNLYPDGGLDLRRVLAQEFDLKIANVIAGSGSEGIMSNIIRAFLCDEDEVLTTGSRLHRLSGSGEVARRHLSHRALSRLAL